MKKRETKQPVPEVTWPVGSDLTFGPVPTDPLGMYTGVPEQWYEEPVQDADDL